jgi:hypothetical protein
LLEELDATNELTKVGPVLCRQDWTEQRRSKSEEVEKELPGFVAGVDLLCRITWSTLE